jgi:serine/threonine protein kinase
MAGRNLGDDRYQFTEADKIRAGGQGKVYRARDNLMGGAIVAIKILHSDTTSDMTFLGKLMLDEATLQASVATIFRPHPNIVFIIDVRPFRKDLGIVMEYVDGGNLRDLMGPREEKRTLKEDQVVQISLQVCEGLAVAHAKGIIHRDIKPANILICDADQTIKIADWGVAKNIDIAGRGKTYLGTPPYMSPEVVLLNRKNREAKLRGVGVDGRTDIYSLGVTMFEMLTGNIPFDGDDEIRAGVKQHHGEILRRQGVRPALATMVIKAMALRPEDRYQTIRDLQADLQRLAGKAGKDNGGADAAKVRVEADNASQQVQSRLEEAWGLQQQQEIAAAEKKFLEIAEQYPARPEVYLELGRFYIQGVKENQALEVLNRGLEIAPDYAPLYKARGLLFSTKNVKLAVADLEKTLALGLPEKEARQVKVVLRRLQGS